MDQSQLKELIAKISQGKASDEELTAYNAYMNRIAPGDTNWDELTMGQPEIIKQELWEKLREDMKLDEPEKTVKLWPRIAAAASVIITLSLGTYFILHNRANQSLAKIQKQDIEPGGNKAIIKRGNGTTIYLTNAKNGTLAKDALTAINKTADGIVAYTDTKATSSSNIVYDTVIIPRKGTYQVNFGDGSTALLNADTKIIFPEHFTGSSRTVQLVSGEAYFEVVHNIRLPFRIVTKNQIVEDIGTHFNINAYNDEPALKTTLIEGAVKVSLNNKVRILKPGEQSVIKADDLNVVNVDTDDVLAWKNGYFQFGGEPLESVMRKVARWYDVEVTYADNTIKSVPFHGTISKYSKVSQVLKKLELTGSDIHFKIENKKIIVTKRIINKSTNI